MKLAEWLKKWRLDAFKINAQFLELEFSVNNNDRDAAWELYVELLTRVTTQALPQNQGDEKTALESIYSIFPTTREVLKKYGASCQQFHRIAIVVLNQSIRPFTAKWHGISERGELEVNKETFRQELRVLQELLRNYTRALSDMAGVEDLTELEED